jgi:hypothetical protein
LVAHTNSKVLELLLETLLANDEDRWFGIYKKMWFFCLLGRDQLILAVPGCQVARSVQVFFRNLEKVVLILNLF